MKAVSLLKPWSIYNPTEVISVSDTDAAALVANGTATLVSDIAMTQAPRGAGGFNTVPTMTAPPAAPAVVPVATLVKASAGFQAPAGAVAANQLLVCTPLDAAGLVTVGLAAKVRDYAGMVTVQFMKATAGYNGGDVAGLPVAKATSLVRSGTAIFAGDLVGAALYP